MRTPSICLVVGLAFVAGFVARLLSSPAAVAPPPPDSRVVVGEEQSADALPILSQPTIGEVLSSPMKGTRIDKLLRFLSKADSAAIAGLLRAAENPFVIYASELKFILAQWVRIDPWAALEYADQVAPTRRFGSLSKYFPGYVWKAWARQDFASAQAAAKEHSESALKMVTSILPVGEAIGDPLEAAEEAFESARVSGSRSQLQNALEQWAASDPEAALEWALAMKHSKLRADAIRGVAEGMAERDPAVAASKLVGINGGRFMAIVGEAWARSDPAAAVAWAKSMDPGNEQKQLVTGLAEELAKTNPRGLLSLLDDLRWSVVPIESAANALEAIAVESPREGIRSMSRLPGESRRQRVSGAAFGAWVSDDLVGAMSWMESNAESPDSEVLASGLGRAVGAANFDEIPEVPELPAELRKAYINSFVGQMVNHDPEALVGWLGDFESGEIRSALNRSFDRFNWSSSADAAAVYLLLEPSDQRGSEISSLANRWNRTAPVEAARWLAQLPIDKVSRHTLADVAKRMVRGSADSAAFASEWAEGIADEEKRQYVIEEMSK